MNSIDLTTMVSDMKIVRFFFFATRSHFDLLHCQPLCIFSHAYSYSFVVYHSALRSLVLLLLLTRILNESEILTVPSIL